ncbi:MAG TPA: hypothetical protein VMZ03_04115 [Chitinophagaceae bacterium]|nr:hypothetical protein [Chitinophagaceae bacterium]
MDTREKIRDLIFIGIAWLAAIAMVLLVVAKVRYKVMHALILFAIIQGH